jgi:hypothetical protein
VGFGFGFRQQCVECCRERGESAASVVVRIVRLRVVTWPVTTLSSDRRCGNPRVFSRVERCYPRRGAKR